MDVLGSEFDLHGAVVAYPGDTIAFYSSKALTSESIELFLDRVQEMFPDCTVGLIEHVSGVVVYRDLPPDEEGDKEEG